MKSIKPLTIKVLLPFLAFLLLFSCSSKVKKESFSVGLKSKILIASDQSEYKDRLRDMLIKRYIKNFNIDIINISDLNEVDEKSYGVILIIDTCMAWSTFNPSLKSFLDRSKKKNTVLFITAGDPDWNFSYKDVDAITSASDFEEIDDIFTKITEKIDGIIYRSNK